MSLFSKLYMYTIVPRANQLGIHQFISFLGMTEAYTLAAEKLRMSTLRGRIFTIAKPTIHTWNQGTEFLSVTFQRVKGQVNSEGTGQIKFMLWWNRREVPKL